MRSLRLLAAFAALMALSLPARADMQGDLDRCKFAGEFGKADERIAACDRVINDSKATAQDRSAALSSRCGWWWTRQDLDRALSDCNEAIRLYSGNPGAYLNRGNAFLSKSDPERALGDFNAAIRLDPKSAWAYAARGNLYKNKSDLDRALADLDEAISLDPKYALALFSRGELHKGKGNFPQAMADMNESLRLDPNHAPAYFTRGQLSYMLGNNPAAIEDFTKSIRLDAENSAAYFSRGVAYYVVGGRVADAVADFRKALEVNPKDAYAAIWRDLAERRNGAPSHLAETAKQLDMTVWPAPVIRHFLGEANAEQTFAAAFDTDPKTKQAQTCEAHFYAGQSALLNKNRKEALRLFKLAADECPPSFIESTAAIAELIVLK
jgi:tetratricopeptide (TPR) repeat protein